MAHPRPIPLLLLPGMDGTGRLFAPLLARLPASVEPVVVGYSRDEPLGYDELLALVRARLPDDGPFVVLGESFSGPLALRLAALRPPGLVGAILVASFVASPLRWAPRWAHRLASPAMFRIFGRLGGRVLGAHLCPDEIQALFAAANAAVSPAVLARRAREALAVDLESSLPRLDDLPVLVLAARHDRLLGRAATEAIDRVLPRAEVRWIDAPHLLLQARPDEAAAAIAGFVRRVVGA